MTCLRCVTPAKCAAWGCSPLTWPSEPHQCVANSLGECGACGRQNVAMPQTPAERQEARRKRLLIGEGRTEVRGIFLPPDLHAELKSYAAKLLKGWAAVHDAKASKEKDSG